MASNAGKAEQKLVVLLSRIAESELVDSGENASGLFEVDDSLVSQFRRGVCLYMLAGTFHPVEWFARVDSITRVQGNGNRVVGEGRQGSVRDSLAFVMFHGSLHQVL